MKTKLLTSILLIATCFVAQNISAYDFSAENNDGVTIYYNILDEQDKICEVTAKEEHGLNNFASFTDYVGDVIIPSSANGYKVTRIGEKSFLSCKSLTSVVIPNSVTSIGKYAFWNCDALTSAFIPNSVTIIESNAFYYCSGLKSITIPNSVTAIKSQAFYGCYGLKSLTIPMSVNSISSDSFSRCSNLESIVVERGNTRYNSSNNCNAIIETKTNVLILGCQNTIIPNTVTEIGNYAFSSCNKLTSITIPNSVTRIGYQAFQYCTALSSITLSNSLKTIDGSVFYNCEKLISIIIPESVTEIGACSFRGCKSLTKVNIPSSVTAINEETFTDCVALTSIEIPNSVTVIRRDAFRGCSKLNNVTIPNSVTSIGDYAFSSCYAFTSINIPNSVKSIGIHAFAYCRYATSLTIPASVTSIDNGAFRDCERLTSVTSYITDVFETSNYAFSNSEQATLYVPSGTLSDYQSTVDWNRFTKIVEMPSIYMSCTDQGKVIINDNFEFTNDIGEVSINNEAENTFVFKPNANYLLTKVLINGEDVTSSVKNNQLTTMIPAGSKMNVVFSQTTGDVNGDGKVDISDVVKLVNIILGGSAGE